MAPERQARFTAGKIPPETLLRTVYTNLGRRDKRVLVGPGIGRDSAAVKQNGTVLVFTADPITGTPSHIGQHSVEINANDIATEIHDTAKRLGISVVGGHTEATSGIDRPIISGFMIGETRGRVLSAEDGRRGDRILLTKTAGLEGTAILARDKATLLKKKAVPEKLLKLARSYQGQI